MLITWVDYILIIAFFAMAYFIYGSWYNAQRNNPGAILGVVQGVLFILFIEAVASGHPVIAGVLTAFNLIWCALSRAALHE